MSMLLSNKENLLTYVCQQLLKEQTLQTLVAFLLHNRAIHKALLCSFADGKAPEPLFQSWQEVDDHSLLFFSGGRLRCTPLLELLKGFYRSVIADDLGKGGQQRRVGVTVLLGAADIVFQVPANGAHTVQQELFQGADGLGLTVGVAVEGQFHG